MRSSGFKLLKIGYCLVSGYIFMKYLRIKPMPLIWFIIAIVFYILLEKCRDIHKEKRTFWYAIFALLLASSLIICYHIKVDFGNLLGNISISYLTNYGGGDIIAFIILLHMIVIISIKFHNALTSYIDSRNIDVNRCGTRSVFQLCIISIFIFIAWLPYFLNYYPGIVYPDSLKSIYQALGLNPFSNHHPVFYTLFIKVCLAIGYRIQDMNLGCAIYTLIQMAYISTILSYSICWMRNKGVSQWICMFTMMFYSLVNCFPQLAISMWKDPIFSATIMFYSLKLFDLIMSRGGATKSKCFVGQVLLASLIFCLVRNNGIYVLILSVCAIIIIRMKLKNDFLTHNHFLKLNFILIVGVLFLTGPVYSEMGIEKPTTESFGIPLQQMARTVVYEGEISQDEAKFLNSLLPLEKYKELYCPGFVDKIKFDREFDREFLDNSKNEFISTWLSLMFKNPKIYFDSWCMNTYGYWSLSFWELNYYSGNIATGDLEGIYRMDNCGIYPRNLLKESGIDISNYMPLVSPMISIGLCTWVIIFVFSFCLKEKCGRYTLVLIPSLGVLLTLLVATPMVYWPRYAAVNLYMLPVYLNIPIFVRKSNI